VMNNEPPPSNDDYHEYPIADIKIGERFRKAQCRSTNYIVQRTDHPHTEHEWPRRWAGLNGIKRARRVS